MNFPIADEYTQGLARLTRHESKAMKATAFVSQVNPARPGLLLLQGRRENGRALSACDGGERYPGPPPAVSRPSFSFPPESPRQGVSVARQDGRHPRTVSAWCPRRQPVSEEKPLAPKRTSHLADVVMKVFKVA